MGSFAGCVPADEASKGPVCTPNAFQTYCKAFEASGAKFWLDNPREVLIHPGEACKALAAASGIKADPDRLLAASRQGPAIYMANCDRVEQLMRVARHARREEFAEAHRALEAYLKMRDNAWPVSLKNLEE